MSKRRCFSFSVNLNARQLASRLFFTSLMRFRATINNFSLFHVFQALQMYFNRFDRRNIRGETNFLTFYFGAVSFAPHGSHSVVNILKDLCQATKGDFPAFSFS